MSLMSRGIYKGFLFSDRPSARGSCYESLFFPRGPFPPVHFFLHLPFHLWASSSFFLFSQDLGNFLFISPVLAHFSNVLSSSALACGRNYLPNVKRTSPISVQQFLPFPLFIVPFSSFPNCVTSRAPSRSRALFSVSGPHSGSTCKTPPLKRVTHWSVPSLFFFRARPVLVPFFSPGHLVLHIIASTCRFSCRGPLLIQVQMR